MRSNANLLLVSILALGLPLQAADPGLVHLSRPDVNFVVGINVAEVASSPLFAAGLAEVQQSNPQWDGFHGLLGANPLRFIDEILISARLDPTGEKSKPENLLVTARGAFGDHGFQELLCASGCDASPYREFEILRLSGQRGQEEPPYLAFLDTQYAVLGSLQEVEGAIDRRVMETNSVFGSAVQEGIDRLGSHHIWLATRGSFQESLGGATEGPAALAGEMASKVDGFGLGISLGQDVQFALELRSHTPEDAKQMFDMVTGLLALMKSGESPPETKQMLERLSVRHEGSILAASLRIPEAEVRQQIRERAVRFREQQTAEVVAPAPRRPRREGGIRIYGLQDEPVEVPTQQN